MSMTAQFYKKFFVSACNKEVDLQGGAIKCSLHDSGYALDVETQQYFDSVTDEIVDGAYPAGGVTMLTPAVSYASPEFKFTGGNISFAGNTTPSRYLVVRDDAPATNATKPLICVTDFGEDKVVLSVTWDTDGIAKITFA